MDLKFKCIEFRSKGKFRKGGIKIRKVLRERKLVWGVEYCLILDFDRII